MQLASNIGLISFEKLTGRVTAGGNWAICPGVMAALLVTALPKRATANTRVEIRRIGLRIYQFFRKKTIFLLIAIAISSFPLFRKYGEDPVSLRMVNVRLGAGVEAL
jgi:hypothetical protein